MSAKKMKNMVTHKHCVLYNTIDNAYSVQKKEKQKKQH